MNKFFKCILLGLLAMMISCKKEIIQDVQQQPSHIPVYGATMLAYMNCYVNGNNTVDTTVSCESYFTSDAAPIELEAPENVTFCPAEGFGNFFDHSTHFFSLYSAPVWSVTCSKTGNFVQTDTITPIPSFPNAQNLSFPAVSVSHSLTINLSGAMNYDWIDLSLRNSTVDGGLELGAETFVVSSNQSSIIVSAADLSNGFLSYMQSDSSVLITLTFTKQTEKVVNGHKIYFRKNTSYNYKSHLTF